MEPKNVKEAMTDPAWIESMQEELLQFKRLDVWALVPSPDNITPLTLKCYQDILAYAAHKSFTVFQMDMKTTFLHGTLKEDVFVCQPKGFIDADHPSHVFKLKKALYGLKQVQRAWYDELSTFLLQNHFFKGTTDPTLFIRRFVDDILVVHVYVDDIIFGSTHPSHSHILQPGPTLKNKKIAVRYHFIKEHVEKGTIELCFVKTDYQLADLFTIALPVDRFNYLVRCL
nr:hypothetical protein [Tanacetum cinerariifolium]